MRFAPVFQRHLPGVSPAARSRSKAPRPPTARAPSIWDEFCRRPGAIADGSDGEIACDHYNRLESDLDLIAALGIRAYRFSISWPRIQPTGSGPINQRGPRLLQPAG